jgi:hypothetical protein
MLQYIIRGLKCNAWRAPSMIRVLSPREGDSVSLPANHKGVLREILKAGGRVAHPNWLAHWLIKMRSSPPVGALEVQTKHFEDVVDTFV